MAADRTPFAAPVQEFCLMIDRSVFAFGNPVSMQSEKRFLGDVTEEQALAAAREAFDEKANVYRVEVFRREFVAEWEKVEEVGLHAE